jgi:uncharacterized protein
VEAGALTVLVETVLAQAWRRDSTVHGDDHWRCVTATGLALTPHVGDVDSTLVFCFGLLHDTRRLNDAVDPGHGMRAASFARELHAAEVLSLDDNRLAVLVSALADHSNGLVSEEPTTGTCWDADRLHLPRVLIRPLPELFSTDVARNASALAAAERLRATGPPSWETLVASVGPPEP